MSKRWDGIEAEIHCNARHCEEMKARGWSAAWSYYVVVWNWETSGIVGYAFADDVTDALRIACTIARDHIAGKLPAKVGGTEYEYRRMHP